MSKNYASIAKKIINYSGGKENFISVENCMTRLRIKYKDMSIVNQKKIAELDDVFGVNDADTFQIVVGPGKSTKIHDAIIDILGKDKDATGENAINSMEQSNIIATEKSKSHKKIEKYAKLKKFLSFLSNIFVPIIPALIASGFAQGINNIMVSNANDFAAQHGIKAQGTLTAGQIVLKQWNMLQISTSLSIIGSAVLSFLAIYVGVTTAKQFKVDKLLGGAVGALTLSPQLPILNLRSGQGGLFGVIVGVWILSIVYKFCHKYVPDILDVILTPTLSLFITAFAYFLIIMPIMGVFTDGITNGIVWMINKSSIIGGAIFSFLSPTIISTGLHQGLTPINMQLIAKYGSTQLLAFQIMSNAGLVGTGSAIYCWASDKKVKAAAKAAVPATFLAVGEPTLFGVVIPSGFGLITASLGAAVGGAMVAILGVSLSAMGAAGMSAIPLVAKGMYLQYLLAYFCAAVAGFIFTTIWAKAINYGIFAKKVKA